MKKKYETPLTEIVFLNAGEVMQGFNIGISGETTPEESDAKQYNGIDDTWGLSGTNRHNLWDDQQMNFGI